VRLRPVLALAGLVALLGWAMLARAPDAVGVVSFTVNTTDDTPDSDLSDGQCLDQDNNCSLRAAIMQANALEGTFEVRLPAVGPYRLMRQWFDAGDDDVAWVGDLDVRNHITVVGDTGQTGTTAVIERGDIGECVIEDHIVAGYEFRIFHVAPQGSSAKLVLVNVEVRGGCAADGDGGGILVEASGSLEIAAGTVVAGNRSRRQGGGIHYAGTCEGCGLSLDRSTITDNSAVLGGGLSAHGTGPGPGVSIVDTLVTWNVASSGGGGMFLTGAATLRRVTVEDNTVDSADEGVGGGGILCGLDQELCTYLEVIDSTIARNTAEGPGGGIRVVSGGVTDAPTATLTLTQVTDNGSDSIGGGIAASGAGLALAGASISRNSADLDGGGVHLSGNGCRATLTAAEDALGNAVVTTIDDNSAGGGAGPHAGGGLYVGAGCHVTATDTVVHNNRVSSTDGRVGGGGIYNVASFVGVGTDISDNVAAGGTGSAQGGGVANVGTLSLTGGEVRGNATTGSGARQGGGVHNDGGSVTLELVSLSGNSAEDGGALYSNGGDLTIENATVDTNTAADEGGGIWYCCGERLAIRGSTISGNRAGQGGGGGIYLGGGARGSLANSTISGNEAQGPGGGIDVGEEDSVLMAFVTIAGNTAQYGGGLHAPLDTAASPVRPFKGVILANNSATMPGGEPDCFGWFGSAGYNLVGNVSGCTASLSETDVSGQDPQLGPLQSNGGPTRTHALGPASPARDRVPTSPDNQCTDSEGVPVGQDQRGTSRPQGEGCDIGAFEAELAAVGAITIVKQVESGSGTFHFTGDPFGDFELSVPDSPSRTLVDLTPGSYQVREAQSEGWELVSIRCEGDEDVRVDQASASVTIDLDAGESVSCTFTNRRSGGGGDGDGGGGGGGGGGPPPPGPPPALGYIRLAVEVAPEGPQQFSFLSDIPGCTSFSLRDDGTSLADRLLCVAAAPGTYSVTPQVPTGWVLAGVACSGGSGAAAIVLGPGETVDCTFRFVAIAALESGDVDCDGQATEADVRALLRHLIGLPLETPPGCPIPGQDIDGVLWGDLEGDGDVDSADAAFLLRTLGGQGARPGAS
jgi:CSLREA domain-containing protein